MHLYLPAASTTRATILSAMREIESNTKHGSHNCIRFVERTTQPDYVYIQKNTGSDSLSFFLVLLLCHTQTRKRALTHASTRTFFCYRHISSYRHQDNQHVYCGPLNERGRRSDAHRQVEGHWEGAINLNARCINILLFYGPWA